jgi:phosphoenolpyruvate synthase/pyruvate phosphate dikinase
VWSMDKMAAPTRLEPAGDGVMVGTAASPGRATGTVRVVRDPSEFDRIQRNGVLVCHCTIPAWSVVFPMVSAIVTEVGGPLSHPGILAREFGIPAVLGVRRCDNVVVGRPTGDGGRQLGTGQTQT